MLARPARIETDGDAPGRVPFAGSGAHRCGPLEVEVSGEPPGRWEWSVANRGDAPVRIRSVALVLEVELSAGPLRMFRHGYQSWSPCDTAVLGVDEDPSRHNNTGIEMIQGVHHADQRTARPGELRSELVTLLASGNDLVLAGFDAGHTHDGTFRLRNDPDGRTELWVEAFLGGAVLAPGEQRHLHGVSTRPGDDASELLAAWSRDTGARAGALTGSPYQIGWCSWYHYFHDVTEADLRRNLALAGDWPFEVFQLDDGFQSAIGDWLTLNDRFPSDLATLAGDISAEGMQPGLWLAPFIAAPDSRVATEHPDWLARDSASGNPLPGMFNPPWGGGMNGLMWTLDTTNPEVIAHLESVAAQLREMGWSYLKLDFTFAPSFDGEFADPSLTPAERVRRGYEAVRRGAGDDAFILGCGAPLGHVIGVVDGNRIGPDVAPRWELDEPVMMEAYRGSFPATSHAFVNTLARSAMHRNLWLNDPDCLMLRTEATEMSAEAVVGWAQTVGVSGGMALVSDDLSLLDSRAREMLDEVISIGRHSDAAAAEGGPAHCGDLLEARPRELSTPGWHLECDLATGAATLEPARP